MHFEQPIECMQNVMFLNEYTHWPPYLYMPVYINVYNIQSYTFIQSFSQAISVAHFQVHYYSEALPTQHGYCAEISHRSATGNCE